VVRVASRRARVLPDFSIIFSLNFPPLYPFFSEVGAGVIISGKRDVLDFYFQPLEIMSGKSFLLKGELRWINTSVFSCPGSFLRSFQVSRESLQKV